MRWTHYLACIFAGFWALNVLPHLLQGINGIAFPTPFASPPFRGLSSPLVNMVWALVNIWTKASVKPHFVRGLLSAGGLAVYEANVIGLDLV